MELNPLKLIDFYISGLYTEAVLQFAGAGIHMNDFSIKVMQALMWFFI